MSSYNIKNNNNEIINTIVASESFVSANYSNYELVTEVQDSSDVIAKLWRDNELMSTDWIVPLSDHPNRSDYMTYRTALRDWPSTTDFPDTKPTL